MSKTQAFLHPRQLADAWGVNYETILRRIARGDIQAINVSPKGSPVKRWRIPASEVNRPGMVEEPTPVKNKKAKR
jgi:predicted site-specific integrase-resolvase